MERLTTTPFGRRPDGYALRGPRPALPCPTTTPDVPKWDLLRRLTVARKTYGLSHRTLAVLAALLSFHPDDDLRAGGALIVFPSNATLSSRTHGMPESTLRRHLAHLVTAGLIHRHDSPNGKRYARRDGSGTLSRAFGFDLAPLLLRAAEIHGAAEEVEDLARRIKDRREECSLLVRDIVALLTLARDSGQHDTAETHDAILRRCQTHLRRRLDLADLDRIIDALCALRGDLDDILLAPPEPSETAEMSASHRENERHLQSSKKDYIDLKETGEERVVEPQLSRPDRNPLTLGTITEACPEFFSLCPDKPRRWEQFVAIARDLGAMLGISVQLWRQAAENMGAENAAVTVACLVQDASRIKNPPGYFRTLVRKAKQGRFTPGPMLVALSNRQVAAVS